MPKKNKKEKSDFQPKLMLVIRIRGAPHMNYKIEDTLKMLRLHKPNHGTVLFGTPTVMGMLNKVKDYVAFGEVDENILIKLLQRRAYLKGQKPLTEEHIRKKTRFSNFNELAKALFNGEIQLKDIYNLKPVFRLHPPKGGYRGSIKKPFNSGGTLGNVGTYINVIAAKMI
ncbi:MAG: 50S ribosomal protein L30 [Promethearchaeota archaeon]